MTLQKSALYVTARNFAFSNIKRAYHSHFGEVNRPQSPHFRRIQKKTLSFSVFLIKMAEREGFEPPVRLHAQLISSQPHSTTLPSLQCRILFRPLRFFVKWNAKVRIIFEKTSDGGEFFRIPCKKRPFVLAKKNLVALAEKNSPDG